MCAERSRHPRRRGAQPTRPGPVHLGVHPQLFVPVGEQLNPDGSIKTDANGVAVDCILEVPATGAAGGAPLPTFESFRFTGPPCSG